MIFYVEFKTAKNGNAVYPVLMVDIDGVSNIVSFDRMLICSLLDVSPKHLASVPTGTKYTINERS